MASIRTRTTRDGNTTHQLQYRHNGRQPSIEFDDYETAAKWRRHFNELGPDAALEMLRVENMQATVLRLAQAGADYIKHLTGVEEGTRRRYQAFMRNDIEPFFGKNTPVDAITDRRVREWVNWLQAGDSESKPKRNPNAPKTIANKHGYLFGLFESLVLDRQSPVTHNPCKGTRLPAIEKAEMTFLEPDEYAALEAALPEEWRLLVRFLVATGARWGEATAMRVGDVDARQSTVRVRRAWKYTGGARVLGPPKTKKSKRTINIDPDLCTALPTKGRLYSAWLFPGVEAEAVQITTFYKQVWVPTLDGLAADAADPLNGKRPRIHDLRHTCASWMLDANVPLGDVQEHLGHESIQTTKDRYGHVSRDAGKRAAAVIGARLPKAGTRKLAAVA